uniref:Secreted protein n=1 Tax=Gasterosteus aculeatus TaxID=69293 RepID=G3PN03_GASAC
MSISRLMFLTVSCLSRGADGTKLLHIYCFSSNWTRCRYPMLFMRTEGLTWTKEDKQTVNQGTFLFNIYFLCVMWSQHGDFLTKFF